MRKHLLAAGIAVVALIPSLAMAQQSCAERSANRAAGTIVGAGLGAVLGSAVAGRGDRGTGAVIGAVGGGIAGNQLSRGDANCSHAYGYYDNNGGWHSNDVARADARGYYDRNGNWIDGAPAGRWDDRGHWVTGDANSYGYNASYTTNRGWDGAPGDVRSRIGWMEDRVRQGMDNGSLNRHDAHNVLRQLDSLRDEEASLRRRHHGDLNDRDMSYLQSKLDSVRNQIHWAREDQRRNY